MARSLDRRRKIAVRRALGASRLGAVREFFFETPMLSAAGGVEVFRKGNKRGQTRNRSLCRQQRPVRGLCTIVDF